MSVSMHIAFSRSKLFHNDKVIHTVELRCTLSVKSSRVKPKYYTILRGAVGP